VAGIKVTPAEVVLLRTIHKANVGSDPVKALEVIGTVERSDSHELRRLREKYPARNKEGKQMVLVLYPGDSPSLPQTFDGVWPDRSANVPSAKNDTAMKFDETVVPLTEAETLRALAPAE
jgi:hypothetical protein